MKQITTSLFCSFVVSFSSEQCISSYNEDLILQCRQPATPNDIEWCYFNNINKLHNDNNNHLHKDFSIYGFIFDREFIWFCQTVLLVAIYLHSMIWIPYLKRKQLWCINIIVHDCLECINSIKNDDSQENLKLHLIESLSHIFKTYDIPVDRLRILNNIKRQIVTKLSLIIFNEKSTNLVKYKSILCLFNFVKHCIVSHPNEYEPIKTKNLILSSEFSLQVKDIW
eukprot:514282_1